MEWTETEAWPSDEGTARLHVLMVVYQQRETCLERNELLRRGLLGASRMERPAYVNGQWAHGSRPLWLSLQLRWLVGCDCSG